MKNKKLIVIGLFLTLCFSCMAHATTIPATIEAESYLRGWGVSPEPTTDIGGGENVGQISEGDVISYSLTVPESRNYILEVRVASRRGGGTIIFKQGNSSYSLDIPSTGGWQEWETLSLEVYLEAGDSELNLEFESSTEFVNINWFKFSVEDSTFIQAEDYLSSDGVKVQSTTDIGGGQNVGYIQEGDKLGYQLDLPAGSYTLDLRVASVKGDGMINISSGLNDNTYAVDIPTTSNWQSWETISVDVELLDNDTLNFEFEGNGYIVNLNWLKLTETDSQLTPESFTHSVTYNGETVTVNFNKFSSRGPLFSVFEQQADGSLIEVESIAEVKTYIGLVEEHPEAYAAGSIRADGSILATVMFPTEKTWRDLDGVVTERISDYTPTLPTEFLSDQAGSDVYAIDVFIDLPYTYVVEAGGSISDALEAVEYNFSVINATFMRDSATTNRLGKIVMRTDASQDPYASITGRDELLSFFEDQDLTQTEVVTGSHHIAALFTPQVAGIASDRGAVEYGSGYFIAGTRQYGNGYFLNDGRHELGHIWGAGHDEGGANLEGPTIMTNDADTNTLSKFSSPSIASILSRRDTGIDNGHLINLGNVAPELPPRAADDTLFIFYRSSSTNLPLLNDNDVNGGTISLLSVSEFTEAGNPVSFDGDTITVSAEVLPDDNYDWVRYTIKEDSTGLTSTAVVHIRIF